MQTQKIWIGYSGGVDSHVLLHIVSQHYKVHAVHINHGLSPNADQWQQHCENICTALNVPLTCIKVNAKPAKGQSPEAAAREARYSAWQQIVAAPDVLLTAHHADDQAETILYRLLRGTGPKGLTGIQSKVVIKNVNVLRPMLELTKAEILQYATEHDLCWINDESNSNTDYDRNFIRQTIMPLLKQRWSATDNINRAGKLCENLLINLETPEILDLKFWQQQTVRAWLHKHDLQVSKQQLDTIINEVINAEADAQPQFKIGSKVIRRNRDKLYVLNQNAVAQADRVHGRKAKKIFQQHGIPPWQRGDYGLVFDGENRLIAITGLWAR